MGILGLILTIVFFIVSIFLILIVAVQDEKEAGLAGIFGGRGGSAFGSGTASVIIKITTWLAVIFFVLAVVLAYLNTRYEKDDSVMKRYNESVANEEQVQESVIDATEDVQTDDNVLAQDNESDSAISEAANDANESADDAVDSDDALNMLVEESFSNNR